jgi:histidinol-phosphate aminotransferase
VIVRPARAFCAPSAPRITIGLPEQNARMLGAMGESLAEVG